MLIETQSPSGEEWNGLNVVRPGHGRWETDSLYTSGWCVDASTELLGCGEEVELECDAKCITKEFTPKQVVTGRELSTMCSDDDSLLYHEQALACAVGECIWSSILDCPDYKLLLPDPIDPIASVTALECACPGGTIVGNSSLLNYAPDLICCGETRTKGGTGLAVFPEFPIDGDGSATLFAVKNPTLVLGPVEIVEGPGQRQNSIQIITIQTVAFVFDPCGTYGVSMKFCGACC